MILTLRKRSLSFLIKYLDLPKPPGSRSVYLSCQLLFIKSGTRRLDYLRPVRHLSIHASLDFSDYRGEEANHVHAMHSQHW